MNLENYLISKINKSNNMKQKVKTNYLNIYTYFSVTAFSVTAFSVTAFSVTAFSAGAE